MIKYSGEKSIYFIGIGGAGMSGIAEVLHNMGFQVYGSDISENSNVKRLKGKGVKINLGHFQGNIGDVDTVVYSSAITNDNVELVEAREKKIPVIPRAEMLAELMRLKYSIAVAGTHGKTTTTSMIATILTVIGMDPTYVVGGKLKIRESGAKLGKSEYLVAEADESDGSFLSLFPTMAVITNIENDHLDYYKKFENLKDSFGKFANKVPFYGTVIINKDCKYSKALLKDINKSVVSFGFSKDADIKAENVKDQMLNSEFDLIVDGRSLGRIEMNIGGDHNISNALASCAACLQLGVSFKKIQMGLKNFFLPNRRFQILFYNSKYSVIDDYGHHPTEIKVTLDLLKKGNFKRIISVFQPHRYSRLQMLFEGFSKAFQKADHVIVTDVYAANQKPIKGITAENLKKQISIQSNITAEYISKFENITEKLSAMKRKGDVFIFFSAGNLTTLAHEFSKILEENK